MNKISAVLTIILTINVIPGISVQSAGTEGHTINLGNTPWKFHKVITKPVNIAPQSVITYDDRNIAELSDGLTNASPQIPFKKPVSLIIDLKALRNIQSVIIRQNGNLSDSLFYTVEGAVDNSFIWGWLADYSKTPQPCLTKESAGIFNEAKFNGIFRFLRITIYPESSRIYPNNLLPVTELEVNVADNSKNKETLKFKDPGFDDSGWEDVGIPHCFNDHDTYLNSFETNMWKGEVWYRKHIYIDKKDKDKVFYLEFQGVNVGAAVYVNGVFMAGNSSVAQPGKMTHVGGFIPFSVDISNSLRYGGENVIAVRVSNTVQSFFTWPGFGVYDGFGMGWGGIVCPVYLHRFSKVHIPVNAFGASGKWGTYQDAVSASEKEAKLAFRTCIENQSSALAEVILQTDLVDANGLKVASMRESCKIPAGKNCIIAQEAQVENPQLWYPNNSPYGKPCLYKVIRQVISNGTVVDTKTDLMGIRVVTWDDDYCYINNKKHLLLGFGYRNVYPALGSAVPASLQWNDISLIAAAGGNTVRVGHVPPTTTLLDACDIYGIMVILNSGDNEWMLKNEPANSYKKEYDRDAIVAYRNHPSVIVWESNNGLAKDGTIYEPATTQAIAEKWDFIQPRLVHCRDVYPKNWDPSKRIMVGYTNGYKKVPGSPTLNTEVYGANWEGRASWNIARFDFANEKRFSAWFVNDYLSDIRNKACGWIDWMLTETQGEGYTIYLNGIGQQKSLGSSAMDANRFPKLKYRIYEKALWVPFETRPGVTLQSHWNLSGVQNVDAWSNCPYVELLINGKSWGIRQPDAETKQCTWENLIWQPGKVIALGMDSNKQVVCSDSIEASDKPYALVLEVEKPLVTPAGKTFTCTANGSDATIVTVRVVDKQGRWCPMADNTITFRIEGEGVYCGSSDFYITPGRPENYHAPFDHELQAEGGLRRIAIRSTFKPGIVRVYADSPGILSGQAVFETWKVSNE